MRDVQAGEEVDIVVLAQLSMTVFKLSYPNCEETFGVPVLTSGETGFERAGDILRGERQRSSEENQAHK